MQVSDAVKAGVGVVKQQHITLKEAELCVTEMGEAVRLQREQETAFGELMSLMMSLMMSLWSFSGHSHLDLLRF